MLGKTNHKASNIGSIAEKAKGHYRMPCESAFAEEKHEHH